MTENMNSKTIFICKEGEKNVFKAQKVDSKRPEFIKEENTFRLRNEWCLKDKKGEVDSCGEIGNAYWIVSGTGETKIITKSVYSRYLVCNEDGTEEYGRLSEFDAA
ncbi:MAG: hypothetical protein IJN50_03885 [Clostridia bacterium]|nr:hypothetical protein [Clostridia bacterium]